MVMYATPGEAGSVVPFRPRYDNFIGGEYVPPVRGLYVANPTPVTGEVFTEVARGTAEDVESALDAAHGAAPAWGRTSVTERAGILLKIADRIETNLETIAIAESAPALAAGNAVVLKPAEQTPTSIHVLNELIADLLPPGVLNIVNGFGVEAGKGDQAGPPVRHRDDDRRPGLERPTREDPRLHRPRPAGGRPNSDRWRARGPRRGALRGPLRPADRVRGR